MSIVNVSVSVKNIYRRRRVLKGSNQRQQVVCMIINLTLHYQIVSQTQSLCSCSSQFDICSPKNLGFFQRCYTKQTSRNTTETL